MTLRPIPAAGRARIVTGRHCRIAGTSRGVAAAIRFSAAGPSWRPGQESRRGVGKQTRGRKADAGQALQASIDALLRRIRLLGGVRASRYATTGGPDRRGTSWDHTGRAPQHRILEGLYRAPHGSQPRTGRGPDLVGSGRLTCYAIGTPASADPRGIFLPARHWDGSPGKVIRHSTRRAARPFGGAGLSSGSVRWRTRKRTDAGGPSGAKDT